MRLPIRPRSALRSPRSSRRAPSSWCRSSPFCYPRSITVDPDQSGKVTVRLRWKPASLLIHAVPDNADLVIDGSLVATAGARVPVPIPEASEDGRREVSVKVSARGHLSQTLQIKLRANELQERTVTLPTAGSE
jgi:hypothetical protein